MTDIPQLKGLSYSGHSVDSSRVAGGDQVKLRDKENKIKVVRGETVGGREVAWGDVGRARRGDAGESEAAFDVEPVDPACCLGRMQVW